MVRFLLSLVGCAIGAAIIFVVWMAVHYFVYAPAKHAWNVYRMDAKNDRVWEEGIARVVRVEVELGTAERVETLGTEIICYEGYFAQTQTLKSELSSGLKPRSIGFEAVQAELPTGAVLDIELSWLCDTAFRVKPEELPYRLEHSTMYVVPPGSPAYCGFSSSRRAGPIHFQTDAGWVGHPHIVTIEERPLRSLATRADLGSSETPTIYSGFYRRWGLDMSPSSWSDKLDCWTGKPGQCDAAITRHCGKNPR